MAKSGTEKNPVVLRVRSQQRAEEMAALCQKHGWKFIVGLEPDKPEDISDIDRLLNPPTPLVRETRTGRNDPCPCGSGKKYKKCCLNKETSVNVESTPKCGLCGKTTKLTKTPCCDQWICDDEENYVPFSYARTSCYRNHRQYTLCGFHSSEGHAGRWQDCKECRKDISAEMYAYYGTNEYNFEKLENPPDYEPIICAKCGATINLAEGGFSMKGGNYFCPQCTQISLFGE